MCTQLPTKAGNGGISSISGREVIAYNVDDAKSLSSEKALFRGQCMEQDNDREAYAGANKHTHTHTITE